MVKEFLFCAIDQMFLLVYWLAMWEKKKEIAQKKNNEIPLIPPLIPYGV